MVNRHFGIMGWESVDVVRFDLGPLLQGQTRKAKLKSAYNSFIIGPRGLEWKTNLKKIMGWESFGVVGFDLGPCLQGQTRIAKLKSAYNSLIMVLQVWDGKQNYRKSLAGTLLVWSDLTLDPAFKVKRG